MKTTLQNPDQTLAFGRWLAGRLRAGQVVSLEGPLGSGKTTLIKGLAQGLGVALQLNSPTFILFKTFDVGPKKGVDQKLKLLVHGDAYRVDNAEEFSAAGLDEYLEDPHSLTLIEWGERLTGVLPTQTMRIKMDRPSGQDVRTITWPAELGKLPADWYNKEYESD